MLVWLYYNIYIMCIHREKKDPIYDIRMRLYEEKYNTAT